MIKDIPNYHKILVCDLCPASANSTLDYPQLAHRGTLLRRLAAGFGWLSINHNYYGERIRKDYCPLHRRLLKMPAWTEDLDYPRGPKLEAATGALQSSDPRQGPDTPQSVSEAPRAKSEELPSDRIYGFPK